jgi:hypothetical protein
MRSPSNLQVPKKIEIYKIVEMLKKETTKEGLPQVEVHFFLPLPSDVSVILFSTGYSLLCAWWGGLED